MASLCVNSPMYMSEIIQCEIYAAHSGILFRDNVIRRGVETCQFLIVPIFQLPSQGPEETNRRATDANYDPVQMDMSEV